GRGGGGRRRRSPATGAPRPRPPPPPLPAPGPAEGGLRSALVNTFHDLGGAAGVAVLSSAAGAGLVAARLASHDFTRAFTVGAVVAAVTLAIAAALGPAVRPRPPAARAPADEQAAGGAQATPAGPPAAQSR